MHDKLVPLPCPICKEVVILTNRKYIDILSDDLLFFCDTDCYEVCAAMNPEWMN